MPAWAVCAGNPCRVRKTLKRAETVDRLSFASTEFVWNEGGMSAAHQYLRPMITDWLRDCGTKTVLNLGCGNGALTNGLPPKSRELDNRGTVMLKPCAIALHRTPDHRR